MDTEQFPLVIEPQLLSQQLGGSDLRVSDQSNSDLCIIDLCKKETFDNGHVPGAIHLEYKNILDAQPPVMGLLPQPEDLARIATSLSISPDKHVIVYDDEGGGKAARLLWTLDTMGHTNMSLLNGGIHAWVNEGYATEKESNTEISSKLKSQAYVYQPSETPIASREYILEHLQNSTVAIVDARSKEEYAGIKKYAAHGGHIPGAINVDWLMLIDRNNNLKLKTNSEIHDILETRGITKNKTIVVYCQTHHRSALVYYALKNLGYPNIKGYPGSWSDWGNRDDTPIESP